MSYPKIKPFGSSAVLLEWPLEISSTIQAEVRQFSAFIEDAFFREVIETVITYNAVAIYLRPKIDPRIFIELLMDSEWSLQSEEQEQRVVNLPVCYAEEMGPDLRRVANKNRLSIDEAISLHSQQTYQVAFIGFLPGFPYLTGLDEKLHTPRLETPRRLVRRGSVAIGMQQTGIYPQDSPGGWNIIGRCPVFMFDVHNVSPCLLRAGDKVRFQEVSLSVYKEIEGLAKKGLYQPQIEKV